MVVVTRRRGVRVLVLVASAVPLLLAGGAALLTVLLGGTCSGSGGVGDAPSAAATREIPGAFLRIYEQVGAQYKLPWEILAGIGLEECDQGRDPDPSCTPQPGARGPGVANFAGASGPMQIGVGGAAGDEYDSLRRDLPDPSLGPHDPTTAVELAALVLIKDKGAPAGQSIAAYALYVREYNGSGPAADAYAARVLADAHAYQGAGTVAFGPSCSAALGTPLGARHEGEDPGERRRGGAGGRPGRRAADDRRGEPDRSLRLQLRRRPRRSGADDEPDQPEPRRGAWGGGERWAGV